MEFLKKCPAKRIIAIAQAKHICAANIPSNLQRCGMTRLLFENQ